MKLLTPDRALIVCDICPENFPQFANYLFDAYFWLSLIELHLNKKRSQ